MTVDHHAADFAMTALAYVDPDAASTTVLVWELAGLLGADRAGDVATCCYTGLVTDTGRFQYQNTDAAALRAAAEMVEAGADPAAVSRAVFQNRSVPSALLEARAVERMRLCVGGAAALSWLSQADFEALGAAKADAEPAVDALRSVRGRARGLHAARAGRRRARPASGPKTAPTWPFSPESWAAAAIGRPPGSRWRRGLRRRRPFWSAALPICWKEIA